MFDKLFYKYGKGEKVRDLYGYKTVKEFFKGIFIKKRKNAPKGKLGKIYHTDNSQELAYRIWHTYISLVIADVIEGDIVKLNNGKTSPIVSMGAFPDRVSQNRIEEGAEYLKGANLREMEYRVPVVTVSFPHRKRNKQIMIRVQKRFYARIMDKIKSGFKYIKIVI
jgi:hypothetical protein